MWKKSPFWLLLGVICLLFPTGRATADLKSLVMPGPVSKAHARFEMLCERCHEPFSKRGQRPLCLECHKTVAADLDKKEGFHGRSPAVGSTECKHCHTEHEGRDADIQMFDLETFDHLLTDFKREGGHLKVACEDCHKPQAAGQQEIVSETVAPAGFYSRAGKDCFACHGEQEPHQKGLGQNCQDCHQTQAWRKVTYPHVKSEFRLSALHKPVSCVLCHPNQHWKKIASDCFSCHRLNDIHGGRYGQKCQDCHTDQGPAIEPLKPKSAWKQIRFDHNKTKFVLQGKHQKLGCDLCHPGQLYGQKLKTDCLSCHQKDDRHRGLYGEKCTQCHTDGGWGKPAFDHQKTRFPLEDKHKKVACSSCHTRPTSGEKLGNNCNNCHQLENVHRSKKAERCERCHSPAGWRESAKFDHDLSRFPLLGLHAVVPCEGCHQSAEFSQVRKACSDCHMRDDKHKLQLGRNCEACHTPNGWSLWQFEHNGKKSFKLEGAHIGLECLACHKTPVDKKIKLARTCAACHQQLDIHQGAFGRNCERCHLSESFKKLKI